MIRVLHIAPRLPPALDGVGEYASRLGEELGLGGEFRSLYLASDPGLEDRHVQHLPSRTAEEFARVVRGMEFDVVLLHYSGYGFHKRGAPAWLVDGLKIAREHRRFRLVIFFHELWASGRPWKSEFYFSLWQRRVAFALRDLADGSVTSTPIMARLLRSAVTLAPVPSALPSLDSVPGRSPLPFRIIIFGHEHTRQRSVTAHRVLLSNLERAGQLESAILAGTRARRESSDFRLLQRMVPDERIKVLRDANTETLVAAFMEANLCLSFYPPHLVTKSTTAAAAFANGCPLVLPISRWSDDEHFPMPPYYGASGSDADASSLIDAARSGALMQMASGALGWYREHANWPVHAARVAAVLRPS